VRALNTRGAAAPGLAAPERAANDNARGQPGASRGQISAGADIRHCATCDALAATLRPDPMLALAGILGVLLARLLRKGGRHA